MDHAAALEEQNEHIAELYRAGDPELAVPTCPEWTVRMLATHLGRGDRWAATIVRTRAEQYVDIRTVPGGRPPRERDDVAGWLREGAAELLAAVEAVGADTPVWTFVGPRRAAWWIRRRLHEATVHRADAALALGADYDLPAELAADGLSEWLDLLAARPAGDGPGPLADGATLHLHATDAGLGPDGEWLVRGTDGEVSWEHGHAKATAAVRGRAVHLLLGAMRRLPAGEGLEVLGDAAIWRSWLERTGF